MREPSKGATADAASALYSRRKFLKRALLAAAYVTPVIVSYPRTVFATHCDQNVCGGMTGHVFMGMTWSPGCSQLT